MALKKNLPPPFPFIIFIGLWFFSHFVVLFWQEVYLGKWGELSVNHKAKKGYKAKIKKRGRQINHLGVILKIGCFYNFRAYPMFGVNYNSIKRNSRPSFKGAKIMHIKCSRGSMTDVWMGFGVTEGTWDGTTSTDSRMWWFLKWCFNSNAKTTSIIKLIKWRGMRPVLYWKTGL